MTGYYTLRETEKAVGERLNGLPIDVESMMALSNLHRTALVVRNHFEQSVLRDVDLSWTGFVVLWVVWIWGDIETRHVAEESGISKGTLTGVARTLANRGLLTRTTPADDRRLSVLSLTDRGKALMTELFPRFNAEEVYSLEGLSQRRIAELTRVLRHMLNHFEQTSTARQAEVRQQVQSSSLPTLAANDAS
ncbi:MarR family winged helix-turn-helix transcriptional regulator [Kutzneria kofuensis]|uniref:DNA-binding MarR family transcriptional regulator n=1 Tax=Kutzneria kofuensis TaxID=103725 RepID=A0A7W9NFT8_9PSEU|nr:MarR family winged helix-turn-helix transcriptional regulator [Kutzneria kofuensis]MBB5890378.1 DNA-binding MarR family transcriptional regulator [Kutzneria kofuensis]